MSAAKTAARPLPQRTCVACRTTTNKRALVRIVRTADGVVADPTGKLPGRGAYVCGRDECWEGALKGALAHSLKTKLSAEDADALRQHAAAHPGGAA